MKRKKLKMSFPILLNATKLGNQFLITKFFRRFFPNFFFRTFSVRISAQSKSEKSFSNDISSSSTGVSNVLSTSYGLMLSTSLFLMV